MFKVTSSFIALAFCFFSFAGTTNAQGLDDGWWVLSYTENSDFRPSQKNSMKFVSKEDAERDQRWLSTFLTEKNTKKRYTDFSISVLGVPSIVIDANKTASQLREKYDDAQNYIEMAEEAKENGLFTAFAKQIKEQKFGDTLKEYGNLVQGIYNDTFKMKEKLVKTKDKLEQGTLDQINRQIERYNKQAEAYNGLLTNTNTGGVLRKEGNGITATDIMAGGQRAKLITPVEPSDLQAEVEGKPVGFTASELEGRQGTGTIGDNKITMDFGKGNQLKISGELKGEGKWNHRGTHVTLETAASHFIGEIDGDTIAGTRHTKDGSQKSVGWRIQIGKAIKGKHPHSYVGKGWHQVGGGTANNKWERLFILGADGVLEYSWVKSHQPNYPNGPWVIEEQFHSKGGWSVDGGKVKLRFDMFNDEKVMIDFVGVIEADSGKLIGMQGTPIGRPYNIEYYPAKPSKP